MILPQQEMEERLLQQSLAVRTKQLPELTGLLERRLGPYWDSVHPYSTKIIDWLKPIVDLSGFQVYPMNGITEGLNWWANQETRGITTGPGEYQWVRPTGDDLYYQSIPSSQDGNFRGYPKDKPVALDLAYVGSTPIQRIDIHDNVERAFFSFSKSFGVWGIRTGYYFVREKDPRLEDLIYGAKYYNQTAQAVGETIIENFAIDYVYSRLCTLQAKICEIMGFTPSDSVWIATTDDIKYERYRRGTNRARICLAGVYDVYEV